MKKIIVTLLLIAVVVVIFFVTKPNKIEGVWKCTYYALYNNHDQEWKEQNEVFLDLFLMKIYSNGKIIVSTSGNENEGTYTLNNDTLNLSIMNVSSTYLLDKKTLTLVDHPRAKIEYTKFAKIEEE
ncbi:MAG: hypothetical protein U9O95_03545 [Candidatus Marinimicrobia bacterium]|nr:hypothetical protein [Candidatus Neomarinimicrobiota bacterium]